MVVGGGVRLHTPPSASPRFPPPRRPRRRPVVDMCHCAQISGALIRLLGCLAAGSSATPQIIRRRRRRHLAIFSPPPSTVALLIALRTPPPTPPATPRCSTALDYARYIRVDMRTGSCQPDVPRAPPHPSTPPPSSLAGRLIPYHCFFAHAFVFLRRRLSVTSPVLTRGSATKQHQLFISVQRGGAGGGGGGTALRGKKERKKER